MTMTTEAIAPSPRVTLKESRDYCESLTRREARNFYYGLKLLPQPKRSAMFALYAYMRLIDDIADAEDGRTVEQRIAELDSWQAQTHAAYADDTPPSAHLLWPAFGEMIRNHSVPAHIFEDAIAGQRRDLLPAVFEDFADLSDYCYRVAGTVGLASIHIWGFTGGEETQAMAVDRGLAFQLTNILRDLREDAALDRCYLPRQELQAHHLTLQTLTDPAHTAPLLIFMRAQIARAQDYYDRSRELESRIDADSRATLSAMTAIYRGLLDKISVDPLRVLRERVSLSLLTKLRIGWTAARSK